MEVARVSDTSIKIKSKNASFLIDSVGKSNEDVLVFTEPPASYSDIIAPLVISGPGEYETAGVSIKGEKHGGKLTYSFLEENQNIFVTASSSLSEIKEFSEGAVIVVLADQPLGETLSEIAADLIIIASPDEFLPTDKTNIKRIDKVNLKKTEEYKGFIVHLSK